MHSKTYNIGLVIEWNTFATLITFLNSNTRDIFITYLIKFFYNITEGLTSIVINLW